MPPMFLNGGGMRGGPVHHHIEGVPLLGELRTARKYRFYSVRDEFPALVPVAEGGAAIVGELYDLPMDMLHRSLLPAEPPELELGTIELEDGRPSFAMLLRREVLEQGSGLIDITEHGGWRAYRGEGSG
ncbi:MAG: hypothetical protein JO168_17540 [Solirubrobacterales bacterium]|nr:hypothetical protein [Solirubrobacterales bacterium]MBV9715246.1 hypothetical protein [Solirubrobacterales bacterium]